MDEDIKKIVGSKIPWGTGIHMPGSVSLIKFLCLFGKQRQVKKFEVATQAFWGSPNFQILFLAPESSKLGPSNSNIS